MKDYIPENPIIQLSDLSDDTRIYQLSKPRNRIFELNVLREIASILNFRRGARDLAEEIIRRHNGENVSFSITDAEFAEKIWPSLPELTRNKKFIRAKKNLREDQQLSKFYFVWIPPRQVIEKNGKYSGVPTKYQPGQYWDASDTLQFQTQKIDLFAMKTNQAQREKRKLLEMILADFGAKRIERARKEKSGEEKEKSTSPPCKCSCSSCVHCAAKGATGGEASGARRVEELRRLPNEDFAADLEAFADRFERRLAEQGMGKEFIYTVKRVYHALEIAEQSARDLIVRSKTGGRLKLVGGQAK